jgi:hypothetical protein
MGLYAPIMNLNWIRTLFSSTPGGVSASPGIVCMKAFVSALACLIPLSAFATEEGAIMQKAFRIITQHPRCCTNGRVGNRNRAT